MMKLIKVIIVVSLIFSLALFTNRVNGQVESQPASYMIQAGDTLFSIANRFNVSVEDLTQANNISDEDFISPGQVILIPGLFGISGVITPVVINIGESLEYISNLYKSDLNTILSLNKIISRSGLVAGSEILVPIEDEQAQPQVVNFYPDLLTSLEFSVLSNSNVELLEYFNRIPSNLYFIENQKLLVPPFENESQELALTNYDVSVSLSPLPLVQGTTASFHVKSSNPIEISGDFQGKHLTFYTSDGNNYYSLQGIHALAEPGIYGFELSIRTENNNDVTIDQSVLIDSGDFETDPPLFVDPQTIDPNNTESEEKLVQEIVSKYTTEKYWTESFSSPAVYQEYTSLFGNRRTYNDSPVISFHSGLDFGGGMTLPIVAPADGKVVFSGYLPIRGNAVFIDHGLGVFTGYFHQRQLSVSVGDFVTTGQKIGEVGNTGRVSNATDYPGAGAHLHWEVWVNGVQVNPLDWLNQQYPE
jgi:murein DD-endopeptidase MepM/ murein hydrolase activator NlpD